MVVSVLRYMCSKTIHKNNLNLQLYTDISRLKRFRKFDKTGCYNKLGILSYQYPLLQEKEEMDNFKLIFMLLFHSNKCPMLVISLSCGILKKNCGK